MSLKMIAPCIDNADILSRSIYGFKIIIYLLTVLVSGSIIADLMGDSIEYFKT